MAEHDSIGAAAIYIAQANSKQHHNALLAWPAVLLPELVRVHVRAMRRHFGCSGLLVALGCSSALGGGWLWRSWQAGSRVSRPKRLVELFHSEC